MVLRKINKNLAWLGGKAFFHLLGKLPEREVELLAKAFARSVVATRRRAVDSFCTVASQTAHTIPNKIACNGEQWLLEITAELGFETIFDVGANVGTWTNLALRNHPRARVHCFEIVPDTFRSLKSNLAWANSRAALNCFGLGAHDGQVRILVNKANTILSSGYSIALRDRADSRIPVDCRITTGELYCKDRNIDHIDMLKIDVEGGESDVIHGINKIINDDYIRLIQFEYNRNAIFSKFLLLDFYEYFDKRNYIVGKLYPNGVEFRPYQLWHEDFQGPNFVACKADDAALISLLSR